MVLCWSARRLRQFRPAASSSPPPLEQIRARGELRVVTLNLPTCYYLGAQGTEGLEFELASALRGRAGREARHVSGGQRTRHAGGAGRRARRYRRRSADRQPRTGAASARPPSPTPDPAAGGLSAQTACARATPCSWSRPSSRCAPAVRRSGSCEQPQEHRRTDTAVGGDRAELRRPARRRRLAARRSTPSSTHASISFAHHLYPNVLVGFALPRAAPGAVDRAHGRARTAGERQRILPRTRRQRAACRSWCRNPRATPAVRVRGIARVPGPRRRPAAAVPPLVRAGRGADAASTGGCWRPSATRSRSGIRAPSRRTARVGIMMLTSDTAQAMGIKDRNDPEQSIFAGARYLAQVREMIPDRIPEPDRTWLTVAAYNVGFGHLEDARIIAQTQRQEPRFVGRRARAPAAARAAALVRIGPSVATRAAGSRCSSSIAFSATSPCSSGSRARPARMPSPPPQPRVPMPRLPRLRPAQRRRRRRTSRRPRSRAHTRRRGPDPQPRRAAKNSSSSRAHSSMSTPPNTSTR